MMGGGAEHRLFRLCIGFKLLFWATLIAIVFVSLHRAVMAAGDRPELPVKLFVMAGVLAALQLCTGTAWFLLRRARLGKARS